MRRASSLRLATPILAVALATAARPAFAQGTTAEREACAPDAIRLCPDTIPDVASTKACMKAHEAELSPKCHAAFAEATQAAPPEVAPPAVSPAPPAPKNRYAARPDFRDRTGDRDLRRAKRVMGQLCASQVLGAETCDFTAQMMRLAE